MKKMHSLGFGIIAIHSTYMQNKYTPTVRSVYQEICTQIRDGRLPWFAYGRLSEKALVYIQPRWFNLKTVLLYESQNLTEQVLPMPMPLKNWLNWWCIRVARSKFEQKPRLISPKTQQNPDFPPKNPVKTHIVLVIYQAVRLWKPV